MPKVEGVNPANFTNYPFLSIHKVSNSCFDNNVIKKDDVLCVLYKNKVYKAFVSAVTSSIIYLYNTYGEDELYGSITIDDIISGNVKLTSNLLTGATIFTCLKNEYCWHVNKDWFNNTQFYLVHTAYLNMSGDCKWVTEFGKFDFEYSTDDILVFKNPTTNQSFQVDVNTVYDMCIKPVEYFQMPPSLDTGGLRTVLHDIELEEKLL